MSTNGKACRKLDTWNFTRILLKKTKAHRRKFTLSDVLNLQRGVYVVFVTSDILPRIFLVQLVHLKSIYCSATVLVRFMGMIKFIMRGFRCVGPSNRMRGMKV